MDARDTADGGRQWRRCEAMKEAGEGRRVRVFAIQRLWL
jgi:hypothetical protein